MCSKTFEDKNHSEEHEDIHVIGGKNYKCLEKSEDGMVCGSVYSAKGNLHAHVKDKHVKPLAKSEYKRKENWDITWETLEAYNTRMEAVKELTTGLIVTYV